METGRRDKVLAAAADSSTLSGSGAAAPRRRSMLASAIAAAFVVGVGLTFHTAFDGYESKVAPDDTTVHSAGAMSEQVAMHDARSREIRKKLRSVDAPAQTTAENPVVQFEYSSRGNASKPILSATPGGLGEITVGGSIGAPGEPQIYDQLSLVHPNTGQTLTVGGSGGSAGAAGDIAMLSNGATYGFPATESHNVGQVDIDGSLVPAPDPAPKPQARTATVGRVLEESKREQSPRDRFGAGGGAYDDVAGRFFGLEKDPSRGYVDRGRRGGAAGNAPIDVPTLYQSLICRPNESPAAMFHRYWGDNPFVDSLTDPQSTFGLDVDTASLTLVRNYLNNRILPPKAAVRTEEFVNYFPSNYPAPKSGDFGIHIELVPSEFSRRDDIFLMKVGVKAREVPAAERKPLALTFVIDVSGSMRQGGRLELVKDAIRVLANELDARDSIGIVVFESSARNVLEPVSAEARDTIANALTPLVPGSSTNVQQGLELGFAMANRHSNKDAVRRVLLFSDGVANTGATTAQEILRRTEEFRKSGIFLSTFGVGMGNHNDHLLEQLADRGDGQCAYIDSRNEAIHLFRKNLVKSFQTIAKDAKVQIDFDPEVVVAHRQIGYENRAIAHRDFRNDSVDAGEVNAGHEVVALYEVELRPGMRAGVLSGKNSPALVKLRYRQVDTGEVIEQSKAADQGGISRFADASPRFRLSAVVAAFADLLRNSYWSRQVKFAELRELAESLRVLDTKEKAHVAELLGLMQTAEGLLAGRQPNALTDAIDEIKYNYYLRQRLASLHKENAEAAQKRLAEDNKRLEEELRRLLER